MSNWMLTYDGVFFISIATILAGSFGLSVRYCLKSKCEKFSICCGLLEINRRVDSEVQEELAMMEMGNVEEENNTNKPINGRTNSPVPKLNLPKKHIQEKNNLEIKEDI
jgi:hypothetical protein